LQSAWRNTRLPQKLIVRLKQDKPTWGAPKIRERLRRLYPDVQLPAISTVHAVLDRHGLVKRRSRHRRELREGTPLSQAREPNDLWCADYKGEFMLADRRYCYPFHDQAVTVTTCGRICYKQRKINLSTVFAGQMVGIKQTDDHIWLVSFMHYDLGYFDDQACRLEPLQNPYGPKVLPMSPV
jgi:hypothetical protein